MKYWMRAHAALSAGRAATWEAHVNGDSNPPPIHPGELELVESTLKLCLECAGMLKALSKTQPKSRVSKVFTKAVKIIRSDDETPPEEMN